MLSVYIYRMKEEKTIFKPFPPRIRPLRTQVCGIIVVLKCNHTRPSPHIRDIALGFVVNKYGGQSK